MLIHIPNCTRLFSSSFQLISIDNFPESSWKAEPKSTGHSSSFSSSVHHSTSPNTLFPDLLSTQEGALGTASKSVDDTLFDGKEIKKSESPHTNPILPAYV